MSEPLGLLKIRFILGIVFVVALIGYSIFAFSDYFEGPDIIVQNPTDGYATTSPVIHVQGVTKRASSVSLNDRSIYIDESGKFDETLHLEPEYNIIKLRVEDRFNRIIQRQLYINRIIEK